MAALALRVLAAALLEGNDLRAARLLDDLSLDRSAGDEGRAELRDGAVLDQQDIGKGDTDSPASPASDMTVICSLAATRYCLPPVLMTANIVFPRVRSGSALFLSISRPKSGSHFRDHAPKRDRLLCSGPGGLDLAGLLRRQGSSCGRKFGRAEKHKCRGGKPRQTVGFPMPDAPGSQAADAARTRIFACAGRRRLRAAARPCYCAASPPGGPRRRRARIGEVAEWSNAPHSKCGIRATVSGVRIPPSPPSLAQATDISPVSQRPARHPPSPGTETWYRSGFCRGRFRASCGAAASSTTVWRCPVG